VTVIRHVVEAIWCPFSVRIPDATSVQRVECDLLEWARKEDLLTDPILEERFRRARFGEFAALVYPDAPDLLVYAKWLAWLFIVDDQFDENRAESARGIERGATCHLPPPGIPAARSVSRATPAIAALTRLWRDMSGPMPEPLRDRFRDHIDGYVKSYASEFAVSRNQEAPPMTVYVEFRRSTGAVETCLDLIERQPRTRVPQEIAASPEMANLRTAANDIICWTNDVLSLSKEIDHGELNNLVAVVRASTGMRWEAALDVAVEMIAVRTCQFDTAQHALLDSARHPAVSAFVEGVRNWIAGSLHWHRNSPRYAKSAP
jgi:hypothetical protein